MRDQSSLDGSKSGIRILSSWLLRNFWILDRRLLLSLFRLLNVDSEDVPLEAEDGILTNCTPSASCKFLGLSSNCAITLRTIFTPWQVMDEFLESSSSSGQEFHDSLKLPATPLYMLTPPERLSIVSLKSSAMWFPFPDTLLVHWFWELTVSLLTTAQEQIASRARRFMTWQADILLCWFCQYVTVLGSEWSGMPLVMFDIKSFCRHKPTNRISWDKLSNVLVHLYNETNSLSDVQSKH